jgi:hypothetical protein
MAAAVTRHRPPISMRGRRRTGSTLRRSRMRTSTNPRPPTSPPPLPMCRWSAALRPSPYRSTLLTPGRRSTRGRLSQRRLWLRSQLRPDRGTALRRAGAHAGAAPRRLVKSDCIAKGGVTSTTAMCAADTVRPASNGRLFSSPSIAAAVKSPGPTARGRSVGPYAYGRRRRWGRAY